MMPAYDADLFNPPAPLAKVKLHNQENGASLSDVPMLIDSGADVTLIPHDSVNQLALLIDPNQSYELIGFNGTTSIARVVELDLIFLKRTFRGRFLIIDQEWGILGRDIINHIPLLLNGPQLNWGEQTTAQ